MPKGGRPPVLDPYKKREILAIVSVGCSRRTAARYVGCAVSTIQNTAQRDPEFAEQLRHASEAAQIEYLKNIRKAAKKEQYWRAAAWALERLNPEEFAKRSPRTITQDQLDYLLGQLIEIVVSEVPVAEFRKRLLKRLDRLLARLRLRTPAPHDPEAEEVHA